jgi:hypothetical protein
MSDAKLKSDLSQAGLLRDLERAQERRRAQFAAIVRLIKRRAAVGIANDMMEQIRHDEKLCKLLVAYEDNSEIIGMMKFVIELKVCALRRD